MTNYLQSRLRTQHDRFQTLNREDVVYRTKDGSKEGAIVASPILLEAEEIIPAVAVTRTEYLRWGVTLSELRAIIGAKKFPQVGDLIIRANGEHFRLSSFGGGDEPPYRFVLNNRERVLLFSLQTRPKGTG